MEEDLGAKRVCTQLTPSPRKFLPQGPSTSTPKSCSKSLLSNFSGLHEVMLSNLPEKFLPTLFRGNLERFITRHVSAVSGQAILDLRNYQPKERTAIIEVSSAKIAKTLINLRKVAISRAEIEFYEVSQEVCSPIPDPNGKVRDIYMEDTFTFSDVESADIGLLSLGLKSAEPSLQCAQPNFESAETSLESAVSSQKLSSEVCVSDLSPGFNSNDLLYEIKVSMWKKTNIKIPDNPLLSCSEDPSDRTKAIEKLKCAESARTVSEMGSIEFDGGLILFEHISLQCKGVSSHPEKENSLDDFDTVTEMVPTDTVIVSGLPPNFITNDVLYELRKGLYSRGIMQRPMNPFLSCCKDPHNDTQALVKVNSIKSAEKVASLKTVDFEDREVDVKQEMVEEQATLEPQISLGDDEYVVSSSAPVDDNALMPREDNVNLAFLDVCIALKTKRPFILNTDNLKNVLKNLKSDHGIEITAEEAKRKHRRLNENHTRSRQGGPFTKHLAYLRGESDVQPEAHINSDRGDPMTEDILASAKFTKGATMQPDAVRNLIDLLCEHRHEYWRVHKQNKFYRQLSAQMVLGNHPYPPLQCKNKVEELLRDYKSYCKALTRTGNNTPRPWVYYDSLKPIFDNMVSVHPELTYSVGAAVTATQAKNPILDNDIPASRVQVGVSSVRVGKERPPAKSTGTKSNESNELLRALLVNRQETLKQMSILSENILKNKKKNTTHHNTDAHD